MDITPKTNIEIYMPMESGVRTKITVTKTRGFVAYQSRRIRQSIYGNELVDCPRWQKVDLTQRMLDFALDKLREQNQDWGNIRHLHTGMQI